MNTEYRIQEWKWMDSSFVEAEVLYEGFEVAVAVK